MQDLDEVNVFGESCFIDCNELIENHQIIYCDYETHDLKEIEFKNLQVGDEIVLVLSATDLRKAKIGTPAYANQVQLATQRLN
ncbi:MAG: hypothetical protein ACOX7J_01445 [Bacillota bacterium]